MQMPESADSFETLLSVQLAPARALCARVWWGTHVAVTLLRYTSSVLLFLGLVVDAVWGRFGIVISIQRCRLLLVLCCGVHLLMLAGCDLPKRPPLKAERPTSPESSEAGFGNSGVPQVALEAPGAAFEGSWDTWDAYFIQDRQVGYAHIAATSIGEDGAGSVQYEMDSRLYVKQGSLRLLQRVSQVSNETNEGRLLSFEGALNVGPVATRFLGTVADGQLKIETIRDSSRTVRTLPWNPTFRGLVALEQSLRQTPMQQKGEERTLKMLLPGRYELATVSLSCVGKASVPLLDGQLHELIEINSEIQSEDGSSTFSTIWTDQNGEIARTHSPALQLIAYRTDQETATNFAGNDNVVASIPVVGEIAEPGQTIQVGYAVEPTAAALRKKIPVDVKPAPGQYVRGFENGVVQVLVSRRTETPGHGFEEVELLPTEADLAASAYADFNHGEVRKFLTLTIKNPQLSAREVAIELTRQVHQNISDPIEKGSRAGMKGFARASLVAQYLIGDSTERAVFLMSLCAVRRSLQDLYSD